MKKVPDRLPTFVPGLDALTDGGLPRGRTTLIVGGPGCGKTILALQVLVEGARPMRRGRTSLPGSARASPPRRAERGSREPLSLPLYAVGQVPNSAATIRNHGAMLLALGVVP